MAASTPPSFSVDSVFLNSSYFKPYNNVNNLLLNSLLIFKHLKTQKVPFVFPVYFCVQVSSLCVAEFEFEELSGLP